jgi:hypothetical protein
MKERPTEDRRTGGIPTTVDSGIRDKLGGSPNAAARRPIGRAHASDEDVDATAGGSDRPAGSNPSPREAAADEEGPVESLGKAVSEAVTGAPRSTPDAPRRR